jgi:hypothetical protein
VAREREGERERGVERERESNERGGTEREGRLAWSFLEPASETTLGEPS